MIDMTKEFIFKFFQYKRSSPDDTEKFEKLQHNKDLCPVIQRQIELMVESYKKYRTITYEMQGFRDNGTDIELRLCEGGSTKYICIQVKSNSDMKSTSYLSDIKGQFTDTMNAYGDSLLDYYIILCCNLKEHSNKNKIRAIEAAIGKVTNVHIIEPDFAMTFIKLGSIQIDAYIKSYLGSEDVIFRKALQIVSDYTPTQRAIIYCFIWNYIYKEKNFIDLNELISDVFISNTYDIVPDHYEDWFFNDDEGSLERVKELSKELLNDLEGLSEEEIEEEIKYREENIAEILDDYEEFNLIRKRNLIERISDDIDQLLDNDLYIDESGNYRIMVEDLRPLIIQMMDANVRYEYEGNELLKYMMNLFGSMKGYEEDNKL